MLFYGFYYVGNKNDTYLIKVRMNPDDKFAVQKKEIIGDRSTDHRFEIKVNMKDEEMKKFLSYIRFLVFDENLLVLVK